MDLTQVRGVKRELESVFTTRRGARPFALGIATPTASAGYRVAVRAATEGDLSKTTLKILHDRTGGELDIDYVGRIGPIAAHDLAVTRGAAIGASVAHELCTAGTLGFFARRMSDGSIGFVSNNHVLAAVDRGKDMDAIFHPAAIDCSDHARTVIGHLVGGYPRLNQKNPAVDCAFARLVVGTRFDALSLDGTRKISSKPAAPHVETNVSKIGRTTGLTHGRIRAFEIDPKIDYSFGTVHLKNQIEIESAADCAFCERGDSGSLAFTRDGCAPVGLIFAASAIGGYAGRGVTYANPIDAVLRALKVEFLT